MHGIVGGLCLTFYTRINTAKDYLCGIPDNFVFKLYCMFFEY
jgi:hypothetical protein